MSSTDPCSSAVSTILSKRSIPLTLQGQLRFCFESWTSGFFSSVWLISVHEVFAIDAAQPDKPILSPVACRPSRPDPGLGCGGMVDRGLGCLACEPGISSRWPGTAAQDFGESIGGPTRVGEYCTSGFGDRRPMGRRAIFVQRPVLGEGGAGRASAG